MKLFKAQVRFKNRRRRRFGIDVLVHARTRAAAEKHLAGKYPGSTLERLVDLGATNRKHFVLADLVED